METEIFINIAQILKIYLFPRGPQIFDRYLEYLGGSLDSGAVAVDDMASTGAARRRVPRFWERRTILEPLSGLGLGLGLVDGPAHQIPS